MTRNAPYFGLKMLHDVFGYAANWGAYKALGKD